MPDGATHASPRPSLSARRRARRRRVVVLTVAGAVVLLAVGGGVESMSRIGMGASGGAWPVDPGVAVPGYFLPQCI